jgi:AraC-like DNA-binding protein
MRIGPATFTRLCRARAQLHEVQQPISVATLAAELGLSPFHFIRQFQAVFGQTPHQLRIEARVALAKRLLAGDQHSVTSVCMEVGCASLGSFSSMFARRVGSTPSRYRETARSSVQVLGLKAPWTPGCLSLFALLPASAFRNSREA